LAAVVTSGASWVTMVFTWTENGTPRTTVIQLSAQDQDAGMADRSVQVATILANAISAMGGFTLTRAESRTEVVDNLLD
jgi:hypothetical protein